MCISKQFPRWFFHPLFFLDPGDVTCIKEAQAVLPWMFRFGRLQTPGNSCGPPSLAIVGTYFPSLFFCFVNMFWGGSMHVMYTETFAAISKKYIYNVYTHTHIYIVKRYKYCFCDECILYLKISVETKFLKRPSNKQPMWDSSAVKGNTGKCKPHSTIAELLFVY